MKKIIDNHSKILNSDYYYYHIIYDFKIKYKIINFINELISIKNLIKKSLYKI
jgi:hypothetical protein